MKSATDRFESLKGGGFLKGSVAGLSEMFLGWRSLLLGCGGTVVGFSGVVNPLLDYGILMRLAMLGIGIVSLTLAVASWRYMKGSSGRNA
ncbi:hypothetical protein [Streptomyces violascens]|uniref:hypothetical protein n=1 Tax=Streptomyces violascens TaxID=67381 RepID=UPI0036A09DFD